ncbi:hypothetical protein HPB51_020992 [Rhipicephalus microplus]|uniref:Uncharacterized protein n=1 Tax=Rhipicephalus microplus TaxID=6941 RepID=A0A9J6DCV8_RHIMP|nr:hypothetical protein HPB51_020992 [Rhipicephalus microplus]
MRGGSSPLFQARGSGPPLPGRQRNPISAAGRTCAGGRRQLVSAPLAQRPSLRGAHRSAAGHRQQQRRRPPVSRSVAGTITRTRETRHGLIGIATYNWWSIKATESATSDGKHSRVQRLAGCGGEMNKFAGAELNRLSHDHWEIPLRVAPGRRLWSPSALKLVSAPVSGKRHKLMEMSISLPSFRSPRVFPSPRAQTNPTNGHLGLFSVSS